MNRPFLLDTCAALWVVADQISQRVADALTETHGQGLLTYCVPDYRLGDRPAGPERTLQVSSLAGTMVRSADDHPGAALAPLTPRVLMEASFLPGLLAADPADRIIAATAREYGYTVLTRDRALLNYGRDGYLSVFPC